MHQLIVAIGTVVLTLQEPATVLAALDAIRARHAEALASQDIDVLVRLDAQLRRLFDEPWREDRSLVDRKYFKPEYAELGVSVGHYSDALGYSGELLAEAHRIDPRSPYRRYTLYAALVSGRSGTEPPDMAIARRYLQEFPDGPFAPDVHLVIAMFNDDLFKFLRGRSRGKPGLHGCYERFVTRAPLDVQMSEARQMAVRHYETYLRLRPTHRDVEDFLANIHGEPLAEAWFYCAD